ncbi:MAG: pyridoxamine 5'-phosphate oxidase family protein [Nocardioides sp.]|nr:pyridoxamine 5'-phosphate oxidase family protein [Nocardioides sp.]
MGTEQDRRELVAAIMKDTRIATLTYQDAEGRLVSMPMGTQDFEDAGTVWFITQKSSEKIAAISARPDVNIAYAADKGWVSLSGTARPSEDRAKLKELWDASAGIFMSGGPDDPDNVLLRVDGSTAEYWESPGKVATAVTLVKGLLTDGEPDLGDNAVIDV